MSCERLPIGQNRQCGIFRTTRADQVRGKFVIEAFGAFEPVATRYRATLQVYTIPETQPRDEATLLANPLGLYVQDFDWQPAIN